MTLRVTSDPQPIEGMPRPELGQVSFQDCSPEKVPHPGAGAWPCWVGLDVVLGGREPGSPRSLSLGGQALFFLEWNPVPCCWQTLPQFCPQTGKTEASADKLQLKR